MSEVSEVGKSEVESNQPEEIMRQEEEKEIFYATEEPIVKKEESKGEAEDKPLVESHLEVHFIDVGQKDAESEAESDIVRNGINIDCNVFKAGHHYKSRK